MARWCVVSFAAAAMMAPATLASAADLPARAMAPVAVAPVAVEYGNIYMGVDASTHNSLAPYVGILYAPFGMHQSGIRISAFGLAGRYEYDSDIDDVPVVVKGHFTAGDVLVGWSHVFGIGAATLSVGGTFQDHELRPHDPLNSVHGYEAGVKVQGDIWVNPTPNTLVFAIASYTPVFDTYYALGRFGFDFSNGQQLFLGPEVGALGNDRTDQVRLGLHLSGIRIGPAKLNISGGWLHERDEGAGGYATATLDLPF